MASLLDLAVPPRLLLRALDDLHLLATTAQEVLVEFAALRDLGERLDERGAEIVELGDRLDRRAREIVDLGERLDDRAGGVLNTGAELHLVGREIVGQATSVRSAADEVSSRVTEIMSALPLLERAVRLGEPLEGAVERLGRIVDRLPGGPTSRRRAAP
jgi:hypothetical protein